MAIVRHLEKQQLEVESNHTETECTYSIVRARDGKTYLQVDTYGSKENFTSSAVNGSPLWNRRLSRSLKW